MAAVTKRIAPHRRLGLSSTPSLRIAQKDGLTSIKGAPVRIDSSGFVASCITTGTHSEIEGTATGHIIGFLQEDGASDSSNNSKVGVTPALPGMMFKGQFVEITTGSLKATVQTAVGSKAGLAKLSGDTHFGVVITPTASYDCVLILELIDPVGTVGGQVGFVVRAAWRQLDL
jgi:hypothetical protein